MSATEGRPTARIAVAQRWGESFDIDVRGHRLVVDAPVTHGGEDDGPTPAELLVAALAAGVAEAVQGQLRAARLPVEPVSVGADFTWAGADTGPHLAAVRLRLELPAGLDAEQRAQALAAAERSPVWQALWQAPELEVVIEAVAPAVPAPAG